MRRKYFEFILTSCILRSLPFSKVFNTSLTWQLRIALGKMGITTDRLIRSVYDSIEAAFLSKDEKVSLEQQVEAFKNGDIHTEPRPLHHNFIERIL